MENKGEGNRRDTPLLLLPELQDSPIADLITKCEPLVTWHDAVIQSQSDRGDPLPVSADMKTRQLCLMTTPRPQEWMLSCCRENHAERPCTDECDFGAKALRKLWYTVHQRRV
eukprot:54385-Eustigmatos_ZCMA.PRE.1